MQGTQVWETKIPHTEGLLILHTAAEDPASHNEYPACRNQDLMEPKEILKKKTKNKETSLVAQLVKNPPAIQEIPVWFLGWEDLLEKG